MAKYELCKCTPEHNEVDALFDCPSFKIEINCPECGTLMKKNMRVRKILWELAKKLGGKYGDTFSIFLYQQWNCQNLRCQLVFGNQLQ